jgi:sigma-B regulation protein RsbU (phosphoserine phosphatase)
MTVAAPYRILVVDDEPDIETLVRQKFRKRVRDGEYEFIFARDGQQALDLVMRDPAIDIVMSDINMPVMDGLTLLGRLGDLNRVLKVVIVSAYGDIQNIRTAMNRGAYDFLTKPIDFEDFELTIRKTIQELMVRREGQKAREQLVAIQQELSIATRIQQSMLPRMFPAFPERQEFEICAEMIPARSVGGDFYDFFLIDGERLGFVIGDVSGKGVPAAIFMAVSRTLLRATALQGEVPGECLQYMNTVLARQCDPAMFVTVFYGILHTRSGEMEYCCGGHNPPYLFSAADGSVTAIEDIGGMVVGAFERAQYETGRMRLHPGDALLLYTDGVTEAEDGRENCFSEERLAAVLARAGTGPVERMIQEVVGEVRAFSGGAAQADDITVMALRYLECGRSGVE